MFTYQKGPTYRCLYPIPPDAGQIPDCNQAGVLGIIPGIIGSYQALEAIKVLTGCGDPLSGKLLVLDLKDHVHYTIHVRTNPINKQITRLNASYALEACGLEDEISVDELAEWLSSGKEFTLLDVREAYEYDAEHLERAVSVPLSNIQTYTLPFPSHIPWVVMCQVGNRSKKAIEILKNRFPDAELINLEGGLTQWCLEMGNLHLEE